MFDIVLALNDNLTRHGNRKNNLDNSAWKGGENVQERDSSDDYYNCLFGVCKYDIYRRLLDKQWRFYDVPAKKGLYHRLRT